MRELRRSVSMSGRPVCEEIDSAAGLYAKCKALRDHYSNALKALTARDAATLTLDAINERFVLKTEAGSSLGDWQAPSDVRAAIDASLHGFVSDFRHVAHDMGSSPIDPETDQGPFPLDSGSCLERWSASVCTALLAQSELFEKQVTALLALLDCEAQTIVTGRFHEGSMGRGRY